MKIIYFAKGLRGQACLQAVLDAGFQVAAVVGVIDEPALEDIAGKNGIPILKPSRVNTPDFAQKLAAYNPDLFILSGYNKILRPVIFEIPSKGTINLHGGKLPEYRGAAPINWQIIHGETQGGCAIIFVDEGIDTGDIIRQELYPITPDDTHASVLRKTLEIFPKLLLDVLKDIEKGTVTRRSQDPLEGSYHTRRYPRDSKIHWARMTDEQVHNLVRGMHGPYPSAFTYKGQEKIGIEETERLPEDILGIPGRVPMNHGDYSVVIAKNRGLLIKKMSIEDRDIRPAEYLNPGDDLK